MSCPPREQLRHDVAGEGFGREAPGGHGLHRDRRSHQPPRRGLVRLRHRLLRGGPSGGSFTKSSSSTPTSPRGGRAHQRRLDAGGQVHFGVVHVCELGDEHVSRGEPCHHGPAVPDAGRAARAPRRDETWFAAQPGFRASPTRAPWAVAVRGVPPGELTAGRRRRRFGSDPRGRGRSGRPPDRSEVHMFIYARSAPSGSSSSS